MGEKVMGYRFGSVFETALRYLILLSKGAELSAIRLAEYDYIATYANDFGLSETNLHGSGSYRSIEYAARLSGCEASVKYLVNRGFATVVHDADGMRYKTSDNGKIFCSRMGSVYAIDYKIAADLVIEKYSGVNDNALGELILNHNSTMVEGVNE